MTKIQLQYCIGAHMLKDILGKNKLDLKVNKLDSERFCFQEDGELFEKPC